VQGIELVAQFFAICTPFAWRLAGGLYELCYCGELYRAAEASTDKSFRLMSGILTRMQRVRLDSKTICIRLAVTMLGRAPAKGHCPGRAYKGARGAGVKESRWAILRREEYRRRNRFRSWARSWPREGFDCTVLFAIDPINRVSFDPNNAKKKH